MYLTVHNAKVTQIATAPTPADPGKNIAGDPGTVRWTGDMQAWIDEDLVQIVRNNQLVEVSQTLLKIPVNAPVQPDIHDRLTVNRIEGIQTLGGDAAPASEVMSVRFVDQGNTLLGYVTLHVVRGGST